MSLRSELVAIAIAAVIGGCTITSGPMLDPRDGGGADAPAIDAPIDVPRGDAGFSCAPGVPGCWGDVHYVCGVDPDTRTDEVTCDEACDPRLGCVACVPGSRRCEGDLSMVCADDGSGWRVGRDCGDWDVACGTAGLCDDACAIAERERSYVGCEYWPVPLANYHDIDDRGFDFRVVATNPNREPAEITITRGARLIARETIAPGAAIDVALPWIDEVSFAFTETPYFSRVAPDGAYRLIATRPIIVAQFNPFHYVRPGVASFSNDASLLLPSHALGTEHVGVSYVPISGSAGASHDVSPGYLALVGVAVEPTEIEVVPSADLAADAGGRWGAARAGETVRFALARGEVAQIAHAVPPPCDATRPGYRELEGGLALCEERAFDLTGTIVRSSRPIAAFGGHVCAYVPYDVAACDHLETTLAPTSTWGTRFDTAPLRDPETDLPNVIRVVAAHDGTALTVTPAVRGIEPGLVLDAGEHVEALVTGPVSIEASRPVEVAQLLVGQNYTDPAQERGDPGLTILVPEEQFRSDYVFVTPTSYTPLANGQSWLLVSREPGEPITIDGEEVDATWARVGARELATVPVDGGAHHASGRAPFGLIAFGLGSYTSYAYPAGLDLRVIPF